MMKKLFIFLIFGLLYSSISYSQGTDTKRLTFLVQPSLTTGTTDDFLMVDPISGLTKKATLATIASRVLDINGAGGLSQEEVEDVIGDMVTDNTEVGITVSYNDTTGKLNFTIEAIDSTDITNAGGVLASSLGDLATLDEVTSDEIADGSIAPAKLSATGTASGTTFLRGDNVWATPPGGGGTGTVTSVGVTGTDGIEVDSGSPVTTSGNIILGINAGTLRTTLNVEDGATADMSNAEVLAALNANADVNILTDAEYTFFDNIQAQIDSKAGLSNPTFITPIVIEDAIDANQATSKSQLDVVAASVTAISEALEEVPASEIDWNIQTAPYTFVADDANDNRIIRLNYDDEPATIPSGVFTNGQALKIMYDPDGVGDAHIKEGAGVSIVNQTNGITLSSYPSSVLIARLDDTTSPEKFGIVEFAGTYADYSACSADPNENNVTAGVTSDPNCNESNNVSNFIQSGAAAVTVSAESGDVSAGTYSLKLVAEAGSTEFVYLSIAGSTGKTFNVSFDMKQTVGSSGGFLATNTSPTGGTTVSGSWTTHSFTTTASGTMTLRFYPAGSGGAGDIGDTILIDNISVIEQSLWWILLLILGKLKIRKSKK